VHFVLPETRSSKSAGKATKGKTPAKTATPERGETTTPEWGETKATTPEWGETTTPSTSPASPRTCDLLQILISQLDSINGTL
jgi:hypothetical protein